MHARAPFFPPHISNQGTHSQYVTDLKFLPHKITRRKSLRQMHPDPNRLLSRQASACSVRDKRENSMNKSRWNQATYAALAIALSIASSQTCAKDNTIDPDPDKVMSTSDKNTDAADKQPPDEDSKSKSPVTLDQVNVVGSRSMATPIDEERDAIGVVDIEATGDIALFPQTNIVDLAKRLPGISVSTSVDRNEMATGEGEYVTIRGFDTSYNSYTLDGLRLPQTESSRAIPMNLFSPFAVASIVADKTPGADKDSDSIAGNIDLRSPTAFDFDGPMTRIRATGQLSELAKKRDQDALGGAIGIDTAKLFGAENKFGVYAAAYYEERNSVAEGVAIQDNWYSTYDNGLNARQNEDALSPKGYEWKFYRSKIERYGASTSLDYHSDSFKLFGRFNYAVYNSENTMDQTAVRAENSGYDENGEFYVSEFDPAQFFRIEDVRQKLFSTSIGGEWKANDFDFSLVGGYANGHYDQPNRVTAAFRDSSTTSGSSEFSLDTSNPQTPTLSSETAAVLDTLGSPAEYYIQRDFSYMNEIKKTLKADMAWNGTGMLVSIGAGALYEHSKRSGISTDNVATSDKQYRFSSGEGYSSVDEVPGEYLDGFFTSLPSSGLKLLSRSALIAQAYEYVPTIDVGEEGLTDGRETRAALYTNAKLAFNSSAGDFEIVPGLRYEYNRFNANFWISDGDNSTFETSNSNYGHLDPSLLATWRPNDKLVLRAAVRSSYSRPSFEQLAGNTTVTRDSVTDEITAISQPNPDLKPVEAWSYDLGLEYYARRNRYFQLALYHKDLKNVIIPTTSYEGYESTSTVDGVAYTKPENGLTGKATGMEVAGRFGFEELLGDGWLSGFGVGANATWQSTNARYLVEVDSVTELRSTEMPQAPKLIYNAEIFYDYGRLRANLWYNYTGLRLVTVQTTRPDVYRQPQKELNFSVAYSIFRNTELGFSVRNLLNSYSYWNTVGKSTSYLGVDRTGGYLETGRIFQVSLTMSF